MAKIKYVTELIIIDDGSIDNLREDISLFDTVYENKMIVNYIYKNNGGVSSARNTGIAHANKQNEYIIFIDGDDDIFPEEYNRLIQEELLNHSPSSNEMICFEYITSTSHDNQPTKIIKNHYPSLGTFKFTDVFQMLCENTRLHLIYDKVYSLSIIIKIKFTLMKSVI